MSKTYVELAVSGVRSLKPYQPGKPISEIEREYGVSDIIKLASNENPLGPGPLAREAMARAITEIGLYPDGSGFDLKNALARRHDVDPSQITLGNGSNDVLVLLAEAFLTPADEAIFSQYGFAVYFLAVHATGAQAAVSPAHPADHTMPYGHDLDAMAGLLSDKTRLVFIANPNNPTGTWLRDVELRAFIEKVPEHALVVVDEAYFEYVDEAEYPNAVEWIEKYPNLVVTRTFSKAFGLAGIRVGYAISHPEIADLLNRIRQPFNVNSLALVAAEAALADAEHLARSVTMNNEQRVLLAESCEQLGLPHAPSVCNFLLVDMGQPARPLFEDLLREAVIVRPVENYGLSDHLRISIGTPEETARLIDALETVVGRHR